LPSSTWPGSKKTRRPSGLWLWYPPLLRGAASKARTVVGF